MCNRKVRVRSKRCKRIDQGLNKSRVELPLPLLSTTTDTSVDGTRRDVRVTDSFQGYTGEPRISPQMNDAAVLRRYVEVRSQFGWNGKPSQGSAKLGGSHRSHELNIGFVCGRSIAKSASLLLVASSCRFGVDTFRCVFINSGNNISHRHIICGPSTSTYFIRRKEVVVLCAFS